MGAPLEPPAQPPAHPNPAPVGNPSQPPVNPAPAPPNAPPAGGGGQLPYPSQPRLAAVLLGAALLVILGTGLWFLRSKTWNPPGYTGGGAAAAAGGEPSTMRIMALAIVLTFCLIAVRTGWSSGALPTIDGNWV